LEESIVFNTKARKEIIPITKEVERIIHESGAQESLALVSSMHLTAARLPDMVEAVLYWGGAVSMSGNRNEEQLFDSREESAMTPTVRGETLVYQQDGQEQVLIVGTAAWYAWLETASTFSFVSGEGLFTARREQSGHKRGGWYWKAYRKQHGKLSSRYIGKSKTVTLARLRAIAQSLSDALEETAHENVALATVPALHASVQDERSYSLSPLLATKLNAPQPPVQLVSRPHLVERLQQAIEHPLTLIAAPAGFGKTTLLSSWLENAALPVAWLSLEQDDDDLTRFWSYVFTALSRLHQGLGTSAIPLLQVSPPAPLPPIETVLSVWINELATLPYEMALVLDDYHLITASPIHRSVTYLIDHQPPHLHLVLATRADPPLPLARLRARGHMTEIRVADLRFTSEEAKAYLNRELGQDLSAEQMATLEARTEGWIAGLHLAALGSLPRSKERKVFSVGKPLARNKRAVRLCVRKSRS
jgi:LuxR family maltose regulon positive regulatory protein